MIVVDAPNFWILYTLFVALSLGVSRNTKAKHVEMLGNHDVIKDVLHIVAGEDNHLSSEDRIFSRIGEISWRINKRLRQARENEKECDTVTPTTPNEENLRSWKTEVYKE